MESFSQLCRFSRSRSSHYVPLPLKASSDHDLTHQGYYSIGYSWNLWKIIAALEFLVIIVGSTFFFKPIPISGLIHPLIPDAHIVHEMRVFHNSIPTHLSPYEGLPTPEIDALWDALYQGAVFRVTSNELHLLPNKTSRIAEDPTGYITTLSVFHNLHCLNYLRKNLYPDYYGVEYDLRNKTVHEHSEHCIDMLRQTHMCMPDTTPGVWQWDKGSKQAMITWDVTHTCLNYDKIHEWAASRALETYDGTIWVEGNPVHGKQI